MDLPYLVSSLLAPVQDGIINNLNAAEIATLSAVSRDVRASVKDRLRSTTHNINLKLAKFFENPKAFRSVQAQTGALISGDFARAFFAGTTASITKLLVYVGGASNLRRLEAFLESNDWIPTDARLTRNLNLANQYSNDGQDALQIYLKLSSKWEEHEHCMSPKQCDACDRFQPTISRVFEQHFTAHLNIISGERAYSLFPRLTILDNGSYVIADILDGALCYKSVNAGIVSLKAAGVEKVFENPIFENDAVSAKDLFRPLRRVGDKRAWTIELDSIDNDSTCSSFSASLETTTFKLHKQWYWYTGGSYYTPITTRGFQYGIFKDSYMIFDNENVNANAPSTRCDKSYISKALTLPAAYKQKLRIEWRGSGHQWRYAGDEDLLALPADIKELLSLRDTNWWRYEDDEQLLALSAEWKGYLAIYSQHGGEYVDEEQLLALSLERKLDLRIDLRKPWQYINDNDLLAIPPELKRALMMKSLQPWNFVNDEQLQSLPAKFGLNIDVDELKGLESWEYHDDELRKDLNAIFEEFETELYAHWDDDEEEMYLDAVIEAAESYSDRGRYLYLS